MIETIYVFLGTLTATTLGLSWGLYLVYRDNNHKDFRLKLLQDSIKNPQSTWMLREEKIREYIDRSVTKAADQADVLNALRSDLHQIALDVGVALALVNKLSPTVDTLVTEVRYLNNLTDAHDRILKGW